MPTALTTTTNELGDSRVRVDVEVEAGAIEREVTSAASRIAREMKIPGFRKGKAPPQVVIQRVGRDAVLDEAVRGALPGWYEQAVSDAGIVTVGDPKLDLTALPGKGDPLAFSIEVGVRPEAKLGEYKGLEVGRSEPEVRREEVDAELERLRESVASLETVDRPAGEGDFLVLDFTGTVDGEPFEGGEARGHLVELGTGRLIEGFEEQLAGAAAGEERDVRVTFPEDYGAGSEAAAALAGKEAVFAVSVKEVKEKRLPDLDDDFATEAGGFDSLDELREDIESRLREAREREIETAFREAALDAVVRNAQVEVSKDLVHAKAHEMWASSARRMRQQGIDPAHYLELAGKTEEQLVTEYEPDAERLLKRESVLAALVEAEGIEVSDEEMLQALHTVAAVSPERPSDEDLRKSLERLRAEGRDAPLREDVAMRKAVDLVAEHAVPISVDQAKARDKLWTPEKERPEGAGELWTPGS